MDSAGRGTQLNTVMTKDGEKSGKRIERKLDSKDQIVDKPTKKIDTENLREKKSIIQFE